jgi:predicted regulator of Ras-like GTPase activity (Roadblock/LC7/MglB family)
LHVLDGLLADDAEPPPDEAEPLAAVSKTAAAAKNAKSTASRFTTLSPLPLKVGETLLAA